MLYVDEIKNGTVIDHINVGKGKKVLEILVLVIMINIELHY
jgi:aspartate carbamoyltransferase regulatory subunit